MIIGIVGSEAAKFTEATETAARELIRNLIRNATKVVSGKCHLGGIDIWAIEEAKGAGIGWEEFSPSNLNWEFYKKRNMQIADYSDRVVCITVDKLPASYNGMKFDYCYHCKTDTHIKSGGCWTVKYALSKHKVAWVEVIKS